MEILNFHDAKQGVLCAGVLFLQGRQWGFKGVARYVAGVVPRVFCGVRYLSEVVLPRRQRYVSCRPTVQPSRMICSCAHTPKRAQPAAWQQI